MNLKKITAILISLTLVACATGPKYLVVSPELQENFPRIYQDKTAELQITDRRAGNHLMQILREDEAASLYSSKETLTTIIEKTLIPVLKKQGLIFNQQSTNKIDVIIDNALISVQQDLLKYRANNEIIIEVQLTNTEQTLTKIFRIKGDSNGPLKADIAVLERDFSHQLAKLLNQIITNQEIQQFIR